MHKDSTTQAKQKKDEREEVLKEIRQLENRQKILENKQRNEERKARITWLYNWSKAEAEKTEGQQPSMIDLWEAQQQLKRPDTRTGKIRAGVV